ncbi:uncharacterized protein LOC106074335 isoform X2 [Biomphalaria glabrata]|nr:uncharacterized protein LOC106074335 isoform X2 [Biomphalaria glabrata]XP_013090540.2 uncharacterized protein LOC106074335 isoform X2 [Biomphalaria glabrata]
MDEDSCTQTKRNVKWPDNSEYTDSYILPSKMPTKYDPWTRSKTETEIDMISGRPRTPNDQYTVLTELQLKNMKKDATPFFMLEDRDAQSKMSSTILPTPKARFATSTSQFLFRDNPPRSNPHCWLDEQWQRDPPEQHNTCRLGASLRWGPSKTGERTISHFHKEDVHRFLNIDMYKRSPTNIPSVVVMKYGRPGEGYYQQRNPNFNTWFGSTHRLNKTNILTNIKKKTFAEYDQLNKYEQNYQRNLASRWPEITEYTDKYMLRSKPEVIIDKMEARKEFHRKQRFQEAQLLQQETNQPINEPQLVPA